MIPGRHVFYIVIVYYWGVLGILNVDLPFILPEEYAWYLPVLALGWLWCDEFGSDDTDDYNRRMSPQILTEKGTFSWDGRKYYTVVNGQKYAVLYGNGCNYEDVTYRGDLAIVCPHEHVVDVGQDVFIGTNFRSRNLPFSITFLPGTKRFIYGDTISPFFTDYIDDEKHGEIERLSAENDYLRSLSSTYHNGYNQITGFVNNYSDVVGMHRKIDQIDRVVRQIEAASKLSSPDKSRAYYDAINEANAAEYEVD